MIPRDAGLCSLLTVALLLHSGGAAEAQNFEVVEPQSSQTISLAVGSGQLLRVTEQFTSLFIADPDVADVQVKSPRLLYLTGTGVGETTLFAVDEADHVLMSERVRVTYNGDALARAFAQVAPGQSVSATTVDQSLVVTGSVASSEEAADVLQVAARFVDDPADVVDRLTVATPVQVNLQVRIAEITRNVDRQLGIRWNAVGINPGGSLQFGFVGGGNDVEIAGGSQFGVGYTASRFNIDVVLQALAEEGLVTLLAEPNLTARSGEEASFLAGGEFPYVLIDDDNDDVGTVAFKEFGVRLNFIPTVLDGSQISLTVEAEVSDLAFAANARVPSLTSRRARTTVDLGSGQSFAIAGLMQDTSSQNLARTPGLGNIPVLGALFRSTGFRRGQTELVILVTPVIVAPTSGRRLATPLDDFVLPNDFERIVLGRVEGGAREVERVQDALGQRRLHGAAGFVFQ
jgi:pilus assembly protein CpaC